jgi:hypothetical protein
VLSDQEQQRQRKALFSRITKAAGRAIGDFKLIEAGDRIAVGMSGRSCVGKPAAPEAKRNSRDRSAVNQSHKRPARTNRCRPFLHISVPFVPIMAAPGRVAG